MRAHVVIACGLAVGCGSDPAEQPPPEDESVVTYTMTTTIPPSSEAEHCKFVVGPPEGLLINRDEVHYSQGSHHFILYDTNYDAVPATMSGGTPFTWIDEAQGVFDCSEGVQFNLDVRQMIAGSQNADGASTVHFPPGVAARLRPNAVLLMNTHYINPSGNELRPEVEIKLHTLREDELEMEGGVLFFFNIFLKAPAMGTGHATMTCDIPEAITISNAQSHMHARGVDYAAAIIDPTGNSQVFYQNTQWENVPVQLYEPALSVAAGSRIEHTCHWNNPGAEDIYVGPRSTDEMCVLLASYYPAKPEMALCSARAEEPYLTNFMGAEWKGQGTATCNVSLECFNNAISGGMFETLHNVTECILASDPAVSPELSDAIGCSISTFLVGGDVFTDCIDAFTACSAK